jgi:PDZ domain-containing protein
VSRRTLTLLLASVLSVVLSAGAVQARVPYVALGPGPTYDTLGEVDGEPLLRIEGRPTFPTEGRLDLTTVGVQPRLTLFAALRGWVDRDGPSCRARSSTRPARPPRRSTRDGRADGGLAEQRGSGAARPARLPHRRRRRRGRRGRRDRRTALREGDVLRTVDGRPLRDAGRPAGRRSPAARSGTSCGSASSGTGGSSTVELRTGGLRRRRRAAAGDRGGHRESRSTRRSTVEITLEDVGGPSAGLMFALGILDKLGEPSLTGGAYIAGTGEISAQGEVGPHRGHRPEARRREGQGRRRLPRTGGQLRGGGPAGTGRPAARRGGQPGAGAHRARGAARGRAAELCPAG